MWIVTNTEDKEELINELWGIVTFEDMPVNKRVFKYGDFGDKFYIILSGEVSVWAPIRVDNSDANDSTSKQDFSIIGPSKRVLGEVMRMKTGQYFGEMALMDCKPRSATIKCKIDSFQKLISLKVWLLASSESF